MKTHFLFLFSVISVTNAMAQPYYGQYEHNHPDQTELTFGDYNYSTPGFFMGGPNMSNPASSFYFDFIEPDGDIVNFGWGFKTDFVASGDNACSTTPPTAAQFAGVDVIEFNSGPTMFLLAAANNDGIYFADIGAGGGINNTAYYTLPAGSYSSSSPIICTNTTSVFVVGSFLNPNYVSRQIYVLELTPTGTYINSRFFNLTMNANPNNGPIYGFHLLPKDAMISPYASPILGNAPELVITGLASGFGSSINGVAGFILRVDPTTVGLVATHLYGQSSSMTNYDGFNSIGTGTWNSSSGFILAGVTNFNSTFGNSTATYLDNSYNIVWSYQLLSSYDVNADYATDAVYRNSSNYGDQFYVTLYSQTNGAIVAKLDGSGNPFNCTPCLLSVDAFNEFNYSATGSDYFASYLSSDNVAGAVNEGVHVFGNLNVPGANWDYIIADATFNGETDFTGCSFSSSSQNLATTPFGLTQISVGANQPNSAINQCVNYSLVNSAYTGILNASCALSALPTNGSNNKRGETAVETEVASDIAVFPNPASQLITITGADLSGTVRITDALGKVVFEREVNDELTSFQVGIDLLSDGVYSFSITNEHRHFSQALIVNN